MLPVRIDSVGLYAHQPPPNYPGTQRERKNNYKAHRQPTGTDASPIRIIDSNRISSSESLSSPSRHHQQRPTTKAALSTGGRGLCNGIRLCFLSLPARFQLSRFYISVSSQRQMLCYTIINRFEATEKKMGGSIERLLNGKLVRSVLRFPIQFFLSCSFTAHQRVVANRAWPELLLHFGFSVRFFFIF